MKDLPTLGFPGKLAAALAQVSHPPFAVIIIDISGV